MSVTAPKITPHIQAFKSYYKLNEADLRPKPGSKPDPRDLNNDGKISLFEFVDSTVEVSKLNQTGKLVNETIEKLHRAAMSSGWTEEEFESLLTIIFEGCGNDLADILTELDNYNNYSENNALFKTIKNGAFIVKGKSLPLLNLVLNKGSQKDPELTMCQTMTIISSVSGLLCHLNFANKAENDFFDYLFKILASTIPVIKGHKNRTLFCSLLEKNAAIFTPEKIEAWLKAINDISGETCNHLISVSKKINSIEDLEKWKKCLEAIKIDEKGAEEELALILVADTIKTPADATKGAALFRSLSQYQKSCLVSLCQQSTFESLEEARSMLSPLEDSAFNANSELYLSEDLFIPASLKDMTEKEQKAFQTLKPLFDSGTPASLILKRICSMRKEVSKKEAYDGRQSVIADTINWDRVLSLLFFNHCLTFELKDELVNSGNSIKKDAPYEQVEEFYKLIPSRQMFREIYEDNPELAKKFDYWQKKHWQKIRMMTGHIFLGDDKTQYHYSLKNSLARQNILLETPINNDGFYASLEVVNLNTMQKEVMPAYYRVLSPSKVMVAFKRNEVVDAFVYNPSNPRSLRETMRIKFGEADDADTYLIYYMPKIEADSNSTFSVSTNYENIEDTPEIFIGKAVKSKSSSLETNKAVALFVNAFLKEDELVAASRAFYKNALTPALKEGIKKEENINIEDIISLMKVMDSGTCESKACQILGISTKEYKQLEAQIQAILKNYKDLSQEEFLLKAIEICKGRVMLASIIS
ncbi:MAG: hypothetical protein ABIB65_05635, partial [Candidatus Margulisiibacteriota bacterium]